MDRGRPARVKSTSSLRLYPAVPQRQCARWMPLPAALLWRPAESARNLLRRAAGWPARRAAAAHRPRCDLAHASDGVRQFAALPSLSWFDVNASMATWVRLSLITVLVATGVAAQAGEPAQAALERAQAAV